MGVGSFAPPLEGNYSKEVLEALEEFLLSRASWPLPLSRLLRTGGGPRTTEAVTQAFLARFFLDTGEEPSGYGTRYATSG